MRLTDIIAKGEVEVSLESQTVVATVLGVVVFVSVSGARVEVSGEKYHLHASVNVDGTVSVNADGVDTLMLNGSGTVAWSAGALGGTIVARLSDGIVTYKIGLINKSTNELSFVVQS